MKMDTLLPIAAPAPAGLIIGIRLYSATIANIGLIAPEYFGVVAFATGAFAAAGCLGMIFSEITAYKYAGVALAENDKKAALVALVAGLICSALVIWSVSGPKSEAVVSSVIISIVGYVALATRDYLARRRGVVASVTAEKNNDNAFTLNLEKEKTKQAAAAARYAKASAAPVQVSTGHTGQNQLSTGQLDPVTLEAARVYFKANPTASAREWIASGTCPVKSPTTASAYKKEALK